MKLIVFAFGLFLALASIVNVTLGQTQGSAGGNCWIIFTSSAKYTGNLGGVVGADAKCEFCLLLGGLCFLESF
jgi:hypothetical protein